MLHLALSTDLIQALPLSGLLCRHALIAVCRFDPATSDVNELKRLLTFSTKFVNSLHLEQLPSHLDLQIIFEAMRRCV